MTPFATLQSSGPGPVVSLVLVVAGVGVLVLFARKGVDRLATMRGTERRPVADVEPGFVEVQGRVVSAGESVDSRTYGTGDGDVVVSQYRQSGGDGDVEDDPDVTFPVPQQFAPDVMNEEAAVPFYVEDDTGRILVDTALADVSLSSDYSRTDGATDRTEVEAVLEAGDTVYVLGEAVPAESYSERATPPGGVLRSVARFFGGPRATAETVMQDDDLVLTRTSSSAEFLVSDTGELRGQLRQGLMTVFWTLSGLVAVAAGVYFLATGLA